MKKTNIIIGLVALVIVLFLGLYIKKQWFDDGSMLTTGTMSSDKVTRLSAAGGDLRVYEFTPQTAPHMQCIFITGESKGSTFCFEKRNNVEQNTITDNQP